MVKERKCRCGKPLIGARKLCLECREKENEYMKTKRRTNIRLDKLDDYA